jgi:hypothetical protein
MLGSAVPSPACLLLRRAKPKMKGWYVVYLPTAVAVPQNEE